MYLRGQLFKHAADRSVTPAQIEPTANLANVTMVKWQYKTSFSAWQALNLSGMLAAKRKLLEAALQTEDEFKSWQTIPWRSAYR